MYNIAKLSICAAALFACAASYAEIKMPRLFSNSMVLQRDAEVNVWGTADAGAKVEVEFDGQKVAAKAAADGSWALKLKPMKESGMLRKMTVSENGRPSKVINDVLVGEVWIVGGQSNMAYPLRLIDGAKEIIAAANNSLIRYFDQGSNPEMKSTQGLGKDPETDTLKGTSWLVCSPKNAEHSFRAVPYIFARDLAQKLNMPVGLIYTAIPGTPMVAWIPRDEYDSNPAFADVKKSYETRLKNYNYQKALAAYEETVRTYPERVEKAKKEGKRPPESWTIAENMRPWKDSPDKWSTPVMLYNIRINPVKNFTARGVIWYQGESDSASPATFGKKLEGFIKIWRKVFNNADMPFIMVQLPSYKSQTWPEIRQVQQDIADLMKNVFVATSIDTGTIDDVHPKEKLPVGERMARAALAGVYGFKDVSAGGPVLKSVRYDGKSANIEFDVRGDKLVCKGEPRGFEVLSGGKWVEAKTKVAHNSISLEAADSGDVSGVRYLYKPWAKPDVCIYNDDGLPAHPFINVK